MRRLLFAVVFGLIGLVSQARAQDINLLDMQGAQRAWSYFTTITTSGNTLTASRPIFANAHVGDHIFIGGQNTGGIGGYGFADMWTIISTIPSTTQITTADALTPTQTGLYENIVYGADSTAGYNAAVALSNSNFNSGIRSCIVIPSGTYIIAGATTPFAEWNPGCLRGADGAYETIIKLADGFSGDFASWSQCWTVTAIGPQVSHLRIDGYQQAKSQQNALAFYDLNDFVRVDDVKIFSLPGRAVYAGGLKNTAEGSMRESDFRDMKIFNSGTATAPVFEISSQESSAGLNGDGSNAIQVDNLRIFGPNGIGLVIRSNITQSAVRGISFHTLSVEGRTVGTLPGTDLVQIGDGTQVGNVNTLSFTNASLVDPYPKPASSTQTPAAIHLMASNNTTAPSYFIYFQGAIGGGASNTGEGVVIDKGRDNYWDLQQIRTQGTNVTIGPAAGQTVRNFFFGHGVEPTWTWNVDSSSANNVYTPNWTAGVP